MNPTELFSQERIRRVKEYESNSTFITQSQKWLETSMKEKYVYNFDWLGRPIIQYPQDIVAMQELIWNIKPDLIIETGIAHGGSLLLSASMLAMLDYSDAVKNNETLTPNNSKRKVIGIDIDIRPHNRIAIEEHPFSHFIQMFEGSSIDVNLIKKVKHASKGYKRILVCLDSMHTHDHVLAELEAYASLVTPGSYCIVFDSFIEDMPSDLFPDRPWGPGNNPKTAIWEYLKSHPEFEIDKNIQDRLQITVAPDGFLRKKV